MTVQFHVGQKVVCINNQKAPELFLSKVYTIIMIHAGESSTNLDGSYDIPGLFFLEITAPSGFEGYDARRFKPVVERKTSIEIFTNILNTQRVRTDA